MAVISVGAVAAPTVSITIKDLTPKFLTFYRAAKGAHLSPDQRFKLWKQDDGFAAVPPTPQGDQIARKLLDAAWPKYPSALERIKKGAAGIQPSPQAVLQRVANLLQTDKSVHITLVVYVGAFEGNAFTAGGPNGVTVALPVEQSAYQRGPIMTHEFTHAVVIATGYSSGGWIRTIGATVLEEGLAMHVAQHFYPDRPVKTFVETPSEPGWLARSERLQPQIFRDVKAALKSSKSSDVMRFTMGVGPSGIDREAYYVGWKVVGYWLSHGLTYADIARIPESEAPVRVGAAIDAILNESEGTPGQTSKSH
jgi:hypothetical protein